MLLHLAAGQLVFTETLDPTYGIEPGIYIAVWDRHDLDLRIHQLHRMPDTFDRVRIRGHHTSRQFRASRVWPRLLGGPARRPGGVRHRAPGHDASSHLAGWHWRGAVGRRAGP